MWALCMCYSSLIESLCHDTLYIIADFDAVLCCLTATWKVFVVCHVQQLSLMLMLLCHNRVLHFLFDAPDSHFGSSVGSCLRWYASYKAFVVLLVCTGRDMCVIHPGQSKRLLL